MLLNLLLVIECIVAVFLVVMVLLQRSEGGGLGIGSGGGGGFMSSRGTANVLTRATAFIAGGFFVTSLILSWLAGLDRKPTSILDGSSPPGPTAPGPIGGGGGLLDQLQRSTEPAVPPAPAGPQVPRSQ
jgi:preprotein translocase subunit SecG